VNSKTGLFLYVSVDEHENDVSINYAAVLIHQIDRHAEQCKLTDMILLDGIELDKRTEQMISLKLGMMLNQSDFVITDTESAMAIQKYFGKDLGDQNFAKFYAGGFADIDFLHQDAVIEAFAYSREEMDIIGNFPEIMALITATCRVVEKKQMDLNFEAYDVFLDGQQKFIDFIAARCGA